MVYINHRHPSCSVRKWYKQILRWELSVNYNFWARTITTRPFCVFSKYILNGEPRLNYDIIGSTTLGLLVHVGGKRSTRRKHALSETVAHYISHKALAKPGFKPGTLETLENDNDEFINMLERVGWHKDQIRDRKKSLGNILAYICLWSVAFL